MALKTIPNSVVLSFGAGEYFSRTPGTADSTTTWTLSFWFKPGNGQIAGGSSSTVLSAGVDSSNETLFQILNDGTLFFQYRVAAASEIAVQSLNGFDDPTAWYHVVVRYDSTETTDTDRIRFWVDGQQLTGFDGGSTWPSASETTDIMTTDGHTIGRRFSGTQSLDGQLADFYFCDGQALSPTDFAEDSNGSWQPITASVTYGAEGFFLDFADSADLGDDESGNVNDWVENVIVAANQRTDTPTANHLTINPKYMDTDLDIDRGNLQLTRTSGGPGTALATGLLPKTGKYYWEVDCIFTNAAARVMAGIADPLCDVTNTLGNNNHGWGLINTTGTTLAWRHDSTNNTFTDTGTFQTGDYAMVAYDADTGKIWFGLNGSWLDSGDPGLGTNEATTITDAFNQDLIPALMVAEVAGGATVADFRGALEDFEGTVPTGFKALDVSTWPKPPIRDPQDYVDLLEYSGDGDSISRTIDGFNFDPGLVWIKSTSDASNHVIGNTIKGGGIVHLNNLPDADTNTNSGGEISGYPPGGFGVRPEAGNDDDVNDAARDYVAVVWKEDSVAGFALVGYTGTAASQAVSHSLGTEPKVMYVRNRDFDTSTVGYFENLLTTLGEPVTDPETDYIRYDSDDAVADDVTAWNDTAPTATQFTVGTANLSTNDDGLEHEAYLWAEVEGFSKFTAYVGNALDEPSRRSPFIYTGFMPKVAFIKRIDGAQNWRMLTKPGVLSSEGYGQKVRQILEPNTTLAATDTQLFDTAATFCASGIKINTDNDFFNGSGFEYIVIAFAEKPFSLKSASNDNPIGDGDIELDFLMGGDGDNPNQYGDGDVDLKFLMNGEGDGGDPKADGAADLKLELGGTGTAPISKRGDGALEMLFEVGGQGFNIAMRGADTENPQLTSNGTIVQAFASAKTDTTYPPLTTSGQVLDSLNLTGNPRLPVLQTNGDVNPDMNAELPVLTASGTIAPGATLRGVATLPRAITTNGTLVNEGATSGGAILPLLTLNVSGNNSTIVSGNISTGGTVTLPALTGNGTLFIPQEMSGPSLLLPALDVGPDAFMAPGAIVTGSVTLPLLRLEAVLANAVALTGTVWSMNTETFETTNYLNYAFDSLVSYQGRPYGVTSSGIFLLEGDDDDGTQIDGLVLSGISDRGIESLKEVAQMYLYGEYGSMMFLLYPDGQVRVREYEVKRRSNATGTIHGRAKGARGLRTRSIQFGFRNLSGGDFTIDKMGLLERILTRKTRKN
jgi:hypothetical protein